MKNALFPLLAAAAIFLGLADSALAQDTVEDIATENATGSISTTLSDGVMPVLNRIATATESQNTIMSTPYVATGTFSLDGGAAANSTAISGEIETGLTGTTLPSATGQRLETESNASRVSDETQGALTGHTLQKLVDRERNAAKYTEGVHVDNYKVFAARADAAATVADRLSTADNIMKATVMNGALLGEVGRSEAYLGEAVAALGATLSAQEDARLEREQARIDGIETARKLFAVP